MVTITLTIELSDELEQQVMVRGKQQQPLTSLAELRSTQSRAKTSSLKTLQQLREEERY